jgi:hypothetical protein
VVQATRCITQEDATRLLNGDFSVQHAEWMWSHLAECATCIKLIQDQEQKDPFFKAAGKSDSGEWVEAKILLENRQAHDRLDSTVPAPKAFNAAITASPIMPTGELLLNRYSVLHLLGRGGMGQVYLARDDRLQRFVAVKLIRPADPALRERTQSKREMRESFEREALIGAGLNHAAIATVHDYGFHRNEPIIVFEYVAGETLEQTLNRRGRLPLDEVRSVIASLAQAQSFAHGRHIVHRDLKPANIRATGHGQYKILDLGLATEFRELADWSFAGTPRYASPEQAAHRSCDGRTDQYALALIAFEMLAGRPVFKASDIHELLRMHREKEPPALSSILRDIPISVEDALSRALAKDPNERFDTCNEFAAALGCKFLNETQPDDGLCVVTKVRAMAGMWNSVSPLSALGFGSHVCHLALAGRSLWAYCGGEVRRWPLEKVRVDEAVLDTLWLRLKIDGKQQAFHFFAASECLDWKSRLREIEDEELPPLSQRAAATTSFEPVVFLRRAPSIRYQTLGTIECTENDHATAEAGLKMRAMVIGADALIDVQEERLADFDTDRWCISGTAIRAVDGRGRKEIDARWFAQQCREISRQLLWLCLWALISAGIPALLLTSTLFGLEKPGVLSIVFVCGGIVAAWGVGALFWLRTSLMPQLLRPAATGAVLVMLMPLAGVAGMFMAYWPENLEFADALAELMCAGTVGTLACITAAGVLAFSIHWCRRSLVAYRRFQETSQVLPQQRTRWRQVVPWLAWTATGIAAAALLAIALIPLAA